MVLTVIMIVIVFIRTAVLAIIRTILLMEMFFGIRIFMLMLLLTLCRLYCLSSLMMRMLGLGMMVMGVMKPILGITPPPINKNIVRSIIVIVVVGFFLMLMGAMMVGVMNMGIVVVILPMTSCWAEC